MATFHEKHSHKNLNFEIKKSFVSLRNKRNRCDFCHVKSCNDLTLNTVGAVFKSADLIA